ncbi:uncharacterized protein LOC117344303 [Pecten maximus]|uniref:uncharacterized protein LOC117344303 n=1 Tax=Pecten maximus TaxID=6579 RepID=UPI0014589F94|nr:uncharacterized protein LOC117344303 [Pecten maximus]
MMRFTLLCLALCQSVWGHGRMLEPPQRSTVWRFYPGDSRFTPNYNDMELFCGGFPRMLSNGGKCGTCGDPYDGVRENEAGGKYATGFITRNYNKGQIIDISIELTTSHMGFFEIRICPNNDVTMPVSPECLDKHILKFTNGDSKWPATYTGFYDLEVQLPADMTCEQCVIQWYYKAGNNWGVDEVTGEGCLGCGNQETFINCADVSISGTGPTAETTSGPTSGPTTISSAATAATTTAATTATKTAATTATQTTTPPTLDSCSIS